ncbi:MAG: hypothetical protein ACJ789_14345 [Thermomicrobiales bacterium]
MVISEAEEECLAHAAVEALDRGHELDEGGLALLWGGVDDAAADVVLKDEEIGGAVAIALVSTVLVSHTNDASRIADPAARQSAIFDGFQIAFIVIVVMAALGMAVASFAFPRQVEVPVEELLPEGEEFALAEATVRSWD